MSAAHTSLRIYDLPHVFQAPESPGVYAWYEVPEFGFADRDHPEILNRELEAICERALPDHQELAGRRRLGRKLVGTASVELAPGWLSKQSPSSPKASRLAVNLLNRPELLLFMCPIYIGQAADQTLRSRLEQHARGLEGDKDGDQEFSRRVNSRGIPHSQLRVVCLPLSQVKGISYGSEAGEAISFVENFLLHAANPPLSKK